MYSILFLTATSFLCCLALTPLVTACSQRLGLVDCPNTNRKLHERPTARTGGVAIALSYLTAFGLLLLSPLKGADSVSVRLAVALMPAALIIFVTGLLDDLIGLRAWQKLTAQFGAAGLAYAAGVTVGGVAGFALQGWWTFAITAVWLVACSNAFNLIDGTDGLAVGVGLFASLTTLAAALMQHSTPLALATAPLVGALVAFLRYNFAPASIFLGDCGSLTLGFLLGSRSITLHTPRFQPGQHLEVEAAHVWGEQDFFSFACVVRDARTGATLVEGTLTVARAEGADALTGRGPVETP